jgi:hypothetical protein
VARRDLPEPVGVARAVTGTAWTGRAPAFVLLFIFPKVTERKMIRKVFGLAGLAGISAALLAAPALAHHAFAMFDSSKVVYMSGTVKQFELVNPHAWLHVSVVNDKGDTSTWSFEGGSVSQLVSLGWKDSFRPGDRIEVGFRPLKDGSRGGQLMSAKLDSGQKLCSNMGCGEAIGFVPPATACAPPTFVLGCGDRNGPAPPR